MRTSTPKGLTLLETIIAIFILATTLWFIQYLYVGLLRGTGQTDTRRSALAATETLFVIWKQEAQKTWPVEVNSADEAYSVSGSYQDYLYRVDVGGRFKSPSSTTLDREYLDLRSLEVTLEYKEKEQMKEVKVIGVVAR